MGRHCSCRCLLNLGWFWFSPSVFAEAGTHQADVSDQGMGSSISLTLWAFLGMESAAQNSAAVENPKRTSPRLHARDAGCRCDLHPVDHGDPGHRTQCRARQIDRAHSGGVCSYVPPVVGSIIMALAVMACLGSLLGWQFTIAQTGRSAADERMFPTFFTKMNNRRAHNGNDRA